MRPPVQAPLWLQVASAAGFVVLTSCAAATRPQQFRTFFLPPGPAPAPVEQGITDPPPLALSLYANEVPFTGSSLPYLPRPTDTEFLLKRANDRFANGKRAVQEGRVEDARREFNRAIEILMSAPEDGPDRLRVEQKLEQMVDAIYRIDADQLAPAESDDQISYDKRPLDEILDLTFPVDPSLRSKVREQIRATTSQLPLQESDAVVSYINFFTSERGRKILLAGLRRSGRYKPMIEKTLAAEGLPQELIFLAQAESGFLPHAVSSARCVGVWQFAKFRGQQYGLRVTPAMDLRMDPEEATRAAARHLHDLYNYLGDWYLAMAAYNCGPDCIDKAVQRTGYADFWTLRRLGVLPKETANYVPAILAMIIVSKNAKDYGLVEPDPDPALQYDTVEMESTTSLALAAEAVDSSVSELRELNPALLKSVAPAGYRLHIPKGTLERLQAALKVIPANRRESWRIHRVETGDTLASLARRYGTTPEAIRSANRDGLPEPDQFAAIPVAYPGERGAARRTVVRVQPPRSSAARMAAAKKTASKPVAAKKPAVRRPAVVAQKAPAKSAAHHPGA